MKSIYFFYTFISSSIPSQTYLLSLLRWISFLLHSHFLSSNHVSCLLFSFLSATLLISSHTTVSFSPSLLLKHPCLVSILRSVLFPLKFSLPSLPQLLLFFSFILFSGLLFTHTSTSSSPSRPPKHPACPWCSVWWPRARLSTISGHCVTRDQQDMSISCKFIRNWQ